MRVVVHVDDGVGPAAPGHLVGILSGASIRQPEGRVQRDRANDARAIRIAVQDVALVIGHHRVERRAGRRVRRHTVVADCLRHAVAGQARVHEVRIQKDVAYV
ncbi:hypothetical protein D3C72_1875190 [compost metagenome]